MELLLIGAAVGAGLAVAAILGTCKVQSRDEWDKEQTRMENFRTCMYVTMAENAKLRLALAAGEMTEDGKVVAAMTMAALNAVIRNHEVLDKPVPELEPEQTSPVRLPAEGA